MFCYKRRRGADYRKLHELCSSFQKHGIWRRDFSTCYNLKTQQSSHLVEFLTSINPSRQLRLPRRAALGGRQRRLGRHRPGCAATRPAAKRKPLDRSGGQGIITPSTGLFAEVLWPEHGPAAFAATSTSRSARLWAGATRWPCSTLPPGRRALAMNFPWTPADLDARAGRWRTPAGRRRSGSGPGHPDLWQSTVRRSAGQRGAHRLRSQPPSRG